MFCFFLKQSNNDLTSGLQTTVRVVWAFSAILFDATRGTEIPHFTPLTSLWFSKFSKTFSILLHTTFANKKKSIGQRQDEVTLKRCLFFHAITEKTKIQKGGCKQLVGYAAITGRYRLTLAFTYFLEAINQVECVKENWKRSLKIREVRTAIWTLFRYFSFAINPTYRMERIQQNHSWIRR